MALAYVPVVPEDMPRSEQRRAFPPQAKAKGTDCLAFSLHRGHVTKAENSQFRRGLYSHSSFAHLLGSALNIFPMEIIIDSGRSLSN